MKLAVVIPGLDEADDGVHWPAAGAWMLGMDRDGVARRVRR